MIHRGVFPPELLDLLLQVQQAGDLDVPQLVLPTVLSGSGQEYFLASQ
jgi:hypothetical protein